MLGVCASRLGEREATLGAGRGIDLARGVKVDRKNPESDDQIGPGGQRSGRDEPGGDDRDIGERIVARRQPGRARQAAGMCAEAGERKAQNRLIASAPEPASEAAAAPAAPAG